MVFSLEHDIKVTKSHQNLLPTQTVIVAHTVVLVIVIVIPVGRQYRVYVLTHIFEIDQ
jgi:hypothetical protein